MDKLIVLIHLEVIQSIYDQDEVLLECENDDLLRLDGSNDELYHIEQFECLKKINYEMKQVFANCPRGICYSISIQITPFDYQEILFIELMKDYSNYKIVSSYLYPLIRKRQMASYESNNTNIYKKGLYYKKYSMDISLMFQADYQRAMFEEILQDKELTKIYIPENGMFLYKLFTFDNI